MLLKGLKSCPHCGSTDVRICWTPQRIVCFACDMQGPKECKAGSYEKSAEIAKAMWNALPRQVKWTKRKPSEEGYYWYRPVDMITGEPYGKETIIYHRKGSDREANMAYGEFAGPIAKPV